MSNRCADVSNAVSLTALAVSVCLACTALTYFTNARTAQAEMLDYPYDDTPLVSVKDIGPNWVHIDAQVVLGPYNLETGMNHPTSAGFMPDNQEHLNQVVILGDYVCRLSDKRGVLLSQTVEQDPYRLWYLVACATP